MAVGSAMAPLLSGKLYIWRLLVLVQLAIICFPFEGLQYMHLNSLNKSATAKIALHNAIVWLMSLSTQRNAGWTRFLFSTHYCRFEVYCHKQIVYTFGKLNVYYYIRTLANQATLLLTSTHGQVDCHHVIFIHRISAN